MQGGLTVGRETDQVCSLAQDSSGNGLQDPIKGPQIIQQQHTKKAPPGHRISTGDTLAYFSHRAQEPQAVAIPAFGAHSSN